MIPYIRVHWYWYWYCDYNKLKYMTTFLPNQPSSIFLSYGMEKHSRHKLSFSKRILNSQCGKEGLHEDPLFQVFKLEKVGLCG